MNQEFALAGIDIAIGRLHEYANELEKVKDGVEAGNTDPNDYALSLYISNMGNLFYSISKIISHLSICETLKQQDIIK